LSLIAEELARQKMPQGPRQNLLTASECLVIKSRQPRGLRYGKCLRLIFQRTSTNQSVIYETTEIALVIAAANDDGFLKKQMCLITYTLQIVFQTDFDCPEHFSGKIENPLWQSPLCNT